MDDKTFAIYDLVINSLLITAFLFSIVSFVINLIFKKCDKLIKTNSIISHLTIIVFIPLYYILFNYLVNTYLVNFTSTYTYSIVNILLVIIATVFTSINYAFKNNLKVIRGFEISSLLITIIMIASMFISQYSDKAFVLLNFITLLFCEYFIVNSNEDLNNKTSKIIYLITNILISTILIICLLSLIIKISFKFDLTLALIALIVLIIALVPLLTAYKTLKKEKEND